MLRGIYEVKKELDVNDNEYEVLVKQGFIVEKIIVDKEGFLSIMIDDAELSPLFEKIRKAVNVFDIDQLHQLRDGPEFQVNRFRVTLLFDHLSAVFVFFINIYKKSHFPFSPFL